MTVNATIPNTGATTGTETDGTRYDESTLTTAEGTKYSDERNRD